MSDRVSILIVDDSRLFRSAFEHALSSQQAISIAGSVFSGEKAIEFIRNSPPDLVTLDVEMPGIDGLETLKLIQAYNVAHPSQPPVGVIMVSAYTRRGAQVTLDALQAGAFDFIAKPAEGSPEASIAALRDELMAKIRAFSASRRRAAPGSAATPAAPIRRASKRQAFRAIVIGASTGGPKALSTLIPELCSLTQLPILIVQHMPPSFTRSLADSLARQSGRAVVEGSDGMPLEQAGVYVAPGGRHMLLRGSASAPLISLNDLPPENGCRPAADVLFRSAAATFSGEVLAVILTGMGRDGTAGLAAVQRAGGYVIAQDEASSVVWGMPGSAVAAGVTDEVIPLDQIARTIAAVSSRRTST